MSYDFDTVWDRGDSNSAKWSMVTDKMGAAATDVIPLSVADMEFKTAPEIIEAMHKSVDTDIFGYCAPRKRYYDAVCGWMLRRHSWQIESDWIVTTAGVVTAVYAAVRAFTQPGEGVVVQTPAYPPFVKGVVSGGRRVIENRLVERGTGYVIDFDALEAALAQPATTMMILCSPHNPIARVWSREELLHVAELCHKHHVLLAVDEIHNDLVYPGLRHTVLASLSPELQDAVVTMTAPTKSFNLAGIQCSNIVIANPQLREKFAATLQDMAQNGSHMSHFGIVACEAAYTHGERWLDELLVYLQGSKELVHEFLADKLPRARLMDAQGTYLLWVDFRAYGLTPQELERRMCEIGRVYLDEGYIFGEAGAGFERINIACPRALLRQALDGMARAMEGV